MRIVITLWRLCEWGLYTLPPESCYNLREDKSFFKLVLVIDRRSASLPNIFVNVPLKVALNDTLSGDCVFGEYSVQPRFGRCCFIATAVDLHKSLTNRGDMMPIKVHIGRLSLRRIDHLCIVFFPILTLQDRVIHLGFDLTHWMDCVCSANLQPLQQPEPPPCASGQTDPIWPESAPMGSRCSRLRSQTRRGSEGR
jgi:hypothetical protein